MWLCKLACQALVFRLPAIHLKSSAGDSCLTSPQRSYSTGSSSVCLTSLPRPGVVRQTGDDPKRGEKLHTTTSVFGSGTVHMVASEHQMCWQACSAMNLLDTSKLMYQGPFIMFRWKYFSLATNRFCYLDKELEEGVFDGGKKLKISHAHYE